MPRSSTEVAVLQPYNRLDRIVKELYDLDESMYTMNYVLQELDQEQYKLVEAMFFQREKKADNVIMGDLLWSRKKFYEIKKATFIRIATKLKII
ncbi:phage transcriptional regulator, ArpU family [Mycobacterium tuberculosis]|nr:phage transcriptional regulator, ArpU family [Mycobacterium tuberculosis]